MTDAEIIGTLKSLWDNQVENLRIPDSLSFTATVNLLQLRLDDTKKELEQLRKDNAKLLEIVKYIGEEWELTCMTSDNLMHLKARALLDELAGETNANV